MAEPETGKDPFMVAAEGRFPLSENPGAARYWTPDGVPRPDRPYWWLFAISLIFGFLGVDHFWLRSPKTGFLKMLTFGGFGLWWLWDVMQILTEKERILNYGLSTPFDMTTGIAQGMITDSETHYESNVNYGLWALSTIFGFLGVDSFFVTKNIGQGLRKLGEGLAMLFSLGVVLYYLIDGLPHSFGGYILFALLIVAATFSFALCGISISVTWAKTIAKAMGTPEKLMQEGIIFSDIDDKQVNSQISAIMLSAAGYGQDRDDNIKLIKKQLQHLKYGSILPQEFQKMFTVKHVSEVGPEPPPKEIDPDDPGSVAAFGSLVTAPARGLAKDAKLVFSETVQEVGQAAVPGGPAVAGMMNLMLARIKSIFAGKGLSPAEGAVVNGALSLMPKSVGDLTKSVLFPGGPGATGQIMESVSAIAEKAGNVVGEVTSKVDAIKQTGEAMGVGKVMSAVAGKIPEQYKILPQKQPAELLKGQSQQASTRERNHNDEAIQAHATKEYSKPAPPSNNNAPAGKQAGGARTEPLSLEGKLMGAATIALIGGGAVKFIIDNLVPE